MVVYKV